MRTKVVVKFGGSSLADGAAFQASLAVLRERRAKDPLVVVSALGAGPERLKVTDALLTVGGAAWEGRAEPLLQAVRARHEAVLRDLDLPADLLDESFARLDADLRSAPQAGSLAEALDRVSGWGERLSAEIMAAALRREGWNCRAASAEDLHLVTDQRFGDASVLPEAYSEIATRVIAARELLVVPGFVGVTADGRPSTLGRGGSDYTAAVLGAALKRDVEIWTDVDGVAIADPNLFERRMREEGHPRTIPELSHEEAYQMAAFGSRVLYAKVMEAARVASRRGRHLRLVVKNTFNPSHPGTALVSHSSADGVARGLTRLDGVQVLTVYLDREEELRLLLEDVQRLEQVRLLMASYSTGRAALVFDRLTPELEALEQRYADAHLSRDQVLVKVVGDGMGGNQAVLGQIHQSLAQAEDPARFGAPLVHKSPQLLTGSTCEFVVRKRGAKTVMMRLYRDLFTPGEVHLGLLGLGTVAGGVVRYTRELFSLQKTGLDVRLPVALVRDASRPRVGFEGRLTTNPDEVIGDPRIDIVLELMGGLEPARTLILRALASGKDVITANKAVLAEHGPEIFEAALRHRRNLGFEGSVCGEIPVIEVLRGIPSREDVQSVLGILNGTSNYLLTRMAEGDSYAEALRGAQQAGFAEADPTLDVSGADAAQKLSILAALAYHTPVAWRQIHRTGVDRVTGEDAAEARRLGYALRPVAMAQRTSQGLEVWVSPALVPAGHPLHPVARETNAVSLTLQGREEPATLVGKGAGALPTARSVVRDVLQVARKGRARLLDLPDFHRAEPIPLVDPATHVHRWWVRLEVQDVPGIFGRIATHLGEAGLSIRQAAQPEVPASSAHPARIMLTLKPAARGQVDQALQQVRLLEGVGEVLALPVLG